MLLNKLPGWEKYTVGYHSDDGQLFVESGQGKEFGEKYGQGDIIGCGVNFIENNIFFTKNG